MLIFRDFFNTQSDQIYFKTHQTAPHFQNFLRGASRFALLFFDDTVITGKFCVGVPLNNQCIYEGIST